mgnify:CR=1 FL=1
MEAGSEKNQKRETLNLIEQVCESKALVNMRLMDHDFEILTVIDDIEFSKKGFLFTVDVPEKMKKKLDGMDHLSVEFEFTDLNKVPCWFTSFSTGMSDNKMCVLFPDVIHREQKREHFRVEAPLEARLCVIKDSNEHFFNVSNVSMGGLLITVRAGTPNAKILGVRERLRDMEFVLSLGSVHIKEAVVVWKAEEALPSTTHFGIKFTKMDKDQRRVLRDIVYELQRAFLARRAGTA